MIYEDKVLTKENIKVEEGDYICADDHLLYCGRCHTPKQVRLSLNNNTKIVNCLCRCGSEKRDSEEEARKRRAKMERIKRLRIEGLQVPRSSTYTFAFDDGTNPKMEIARSYVKNWEQCRKENIGMLLTGSIGSGKSFFAGCIANALIDQGVPVMMTSIPRMLQTMTMLRGDSIADYVCGLDRYPLLILDDFDPKRLSAIQRRMLFTIIDRRYGRGDPMILITPRSIESLKLAARSDVMMDASLARVLEVCQPVAFLDKDFHQIRAKDRREIAKAILGKTRRETHAG